MKLLLNMNEFLKNVFQNIPWALGICFHKEVYSGCHCISHFSEQQVTSIKIAVTSKEG